MTPPVSRLAAHLLALLTSRHEAEALLGDLAEDFSRLDAASQVRWPRLWIEGRAWQYVLASAREASRRARTAMGYLVRDAARSVAAGRGHSALIVAILALSIAAATVTFSVVDAVVLKPLPFQSGHELVAFEFRDPAAPQVRALSPAHYLTLQTRMPSLGSLAAIHRGRLALTLTRGGETEPITSTRATASLFDVLRTRPLLGRTFSAADEVAGREHLAVIGYELWQSKFGGDPTVIGRTIPVSAGYIGDDGQTMSLLVVGIMPAGFTYPVSQNGRTSTSERTQIWTPYVMTPEERAGGDGSLGGSRYLSLVGRLRPGSSLEQARTQVTTIGEPLVVERLKDLLVAPVRGWMLMALVAVAIVVALACVNVANLQLTRAAYRARELSIRASLGASRRQLIFSLIVESLLLSLSAAAFGVIAAAWGIAVAKGALPAGIARADEIALNMRVLMAAIGAATASGLLFGMVPAWQASREDFVSLLKQSAKSVAGGHLPWRAAFAAAQVAFVCVLLVSSTLIISSFIRVTTADLGFVRSGLLVIGGGTPPGTIWDTMERLRELPGVASVAAVENGSPPLVAAGFGGGSSGTMIRAADAPDDAKLTRVEFRRVSASYFETAGLVVTRGRIFDERDAPRRDTVVIDEATAAALFGTRNPIGAEIKWPLGTRRVAAVVRDVLANGPERPVVPQIYLADPLPSGQLLVRITHPPATVIPSLRAALPSGGSASSPPTIRLLDEAFRNITADRRFNASLMSLFAILAIAIGAAGVYGVMSSIVAQRTREIGVRVALGASMPNVVRGVLLQSLRYVGLGLLAGVPAAFATSKVFGHVLFQVQPTDPSTYVIVVALLIIVGLAAAIVPALRAARVDPIVALRTE